MPELDRELGFDTDLDVGTQETEESVVVTPETRQFVDVFGFSPEQNIIHDNENESHDAPVGHEIDIETANGGDASKVVDFKHPELEIGEQSTPVVVVTPEKKVHANMPIVKDVEEIGGRGDVDQDIDIAALKAKVSQLETELESKSTIHEFEEGTVLTDEILTKVKSGDIVKVLQMEFVVNNKANMSPRTISGSIVGAASESSLTILKLDWVKGQELEPTSVVYTFGDTQTETEPNSEE